MSSGQREALGSGALCARRSSDGGAKEGSTDMGECFGDDGGAKDAQKPGKKVIVAGD